MNDSSPPPPRDPWAPGVRAADVPVAEVNEPNPLDSPDARPDAKEGDPKQTSNLPPPPGAPIVEHAVYYASRGWPVFPCKPANKAPFFEGGFHRATTDEKTI